MIPTHLHFDHAGAVGAFPNAEVLVSRREYLAHRLLPLGSSIHRWPDGTSTTLLAHDDGRYGSFPASHRVTDAGDVVVVPTPGHTPSHQSVVVREGDSLLLLAGDTTFTEAQLLANEVVDLSMDARRSRRTMAQIRRLCGYERVVYLPTHDPEAAERLESRTPTVIDGSGRL